jgi:hypothetical protein
MRSQGLCFNCGKNGPYRRELLKRLIDGVKGTEETNPIDSKEPEPEAPCPERANHKLDQQVLNTKKKVTFSNMVEIIPRLAGAAAYRHGVHLRCVASWGAADLYRNQHQRTTSIRSPV